MGGGLLAYPPQTQTLEPPLSSDAARIESLETKAAFQEDALQQLSDALVAQQARIDRLQAQLLVLAEQLQTQSDDGAPAADERPPHY